MPPFVGPLGALSRSLRCSFVDYGARRPPARAPNALPEKPRPRRCAKRMAGQRPQLRMAKTGAPPAWLLCCCVGIRRRSVLRYGAGAGTQVQGGDNTSCRARAGCKQLGSVGRTMLAPSIPRRLASAPSEERSDERSIVPTPNLRGQKAVTGDGAHPLQLASSDLSPRAGPAVPAAGSAQS